MNKGIDPLGDGYLCPDWQNSALITIDVQRDFSLDGAIAEIPGTKEAVSHILRLLKAFRKTGLPIFHIVRLYLTDGSNVDVCRRSIIERGTRIVTPGSDGSQLVQELLPHAQITLDHELLLSGRVQEIASNEWILYKPRFGAFYNTGLHQYLEQLDVNTLVFSGCNFPNCPRTSIYQATERDYKVVVARDSLSGLYDKGIDEMRNIGINIMMSDDIINSLNQKILQ